MKSLRARGPRGWSVWKMARWFIGRVSETVRRPASFASMRVGGRGTFLGRRDRLGTPADEEARMRNRAGDRKPRRPDTVENRTRRARRVCGRATSLMRTSGVSILDNVVFG